MTTIDSLLVPISSNIKTIQHDIPRKDKRILLSLAKQLFSGVFLTENQGKLLIKIIKENILPMKSIIPDAEAIIEDQKWSKTFREVNKIKKIYLSQDFPNSFVVEFSYNTKFREKISKINSSMRGSLISVGSKYVVNLTEENVSMIVDAFLPDGFEIDQKILNFYQEIQEIQEKTKNPFDVFNLQNQKLKKSLENDLGSEFLNNSLLLQDRKIRYQYTNDQKIQEFSLEDKIANRDSRKIFINSETVSFDQVLDSVKILDRFPVMLIFDGHQSSKDKKYLKFLENAVSSLNLGDDIGIYFRYNKESDTDKFNQEIGLLGYNKNLSDTTIVAGISNSKIPKFMIKNQWKPKTVISFTPNFRSNKSYVYCSDVDLLIYYGNTKPLDREVHVLM